MTREREESIKVLQHCGAEIYCQHYIKTRHCYGCNRREALDMAIEALNEVQKHEETFEWCHDCKEYDTENYCCHRWSKVIRNTVEELKEEPPTIPCFTGSAEAYKAWTGEDMGKTSDLISRADAIAYIDRVIKSGLGRNKSLDYIRKYISALPSADAEQTELPQYEEWQDSFNKMCESARPKTFVADEWYRDTFKGEEE